MKSECSKIMLPLVVDSSGNANGGKLITKQKHCKKFFHQGKYIVVLWNLPASVNVSKTCATKMLAASVNKRFGRELLKRQTLFLVY